MIRVRRMFVTAGMVELYVNTTPGTDTITETIQTTDEPNNAAQQQALNHIEEGGEEIISITRFGDMTRRDIECFYVYSRTR